MSAATKHHTLCSPGKHQASRSAYPTRQLDIMVSMLQGAVSQPSKTEAVACSDV